MTLWKITHHDDQAGFSLKKKNWINIHKLINVICHINKLEDIRYHTIISHDAKKALEIFQYTCMTNIL